MMKVLQGRLLRFGVFVLVALIFMALATQLRAEVTAFKLAVAEAAADDRDLAEFYRNSGYRAIWTGTAPEDQARRAALVTALSGAPAHGLPEARYELPGLLAKLQQVETPRDLGFAEVALSSAFLRLADDLQSGILDKSRVLPSNKRETLHRDRLAYLEEITSADPVAYLRGLAPATTEYARLMREKARLEHLVAHGGWGATVPVDSLRPGATGQAVISLRDRLIAMGYLQRSASASYDDRLEAAVRRFQETHGLKADGVAGRITMAEINKGPEARLKSVLVALERERWFNRERGERHILVNITDFSSRIIRNDAQIFETRSIVGRATSDRQTPEFSDLMDHMVINPTWHLPRSIVARDYLPRLQRNPNAVSYLRFFDSRGRQVSRSNIDFSRYTGRNFPYAVQQPPSPRNALGRVKFMFPNKYNIYLHDTPQKELFANDLPAHSSGCVRLAEPFEFAYVLLADQSDDPQGLFHSTLNTGRETRITLENPIPIHIIYRTAFVTASGEAHYRRDVYGRDEVIWNALEQAGVSLPAVQG